MTLDSYTTVLWKKECKEEHARLTDQFEELEEQLRKLKRMRDALAGGLSTSTCSGGEEGSSTGDAAAEGAEVAGGEKKKGGWFGGGKKRKHRDERSKAKYSEKLSAQLSTIKRRTTDYIPDDVDPSEVDKAMSVDFKGIDQSIAGIDHSIDVLEDMIEKLEAEAVLNSSLRDRLASSQISLASDDRRARWRPVLVLVLVHVLVLALVLERVRILESSY